MSGKHFHFDEKDGGYYVCSLCECPLKTHCFYVHCPLLDKELICVDCCHTSVPEKEVIEKFKALGKEYTRETIDKTCEDCGNRSVGKEESNVDNKSDVSTDRHEDSSDRKPS